MFIENRKQREEEKKAQEGEAAGGGAACSGGSLRKDPFISCRLLQDTADQHAGRRGLSACFSCGVHCVPGAWMLQRFASPGGVREAPQTASGPSFWPAEARLSALSKGEIALHSAW